MGEDSKSDRNKKGRGGARIKEMEKNEKINHPDWRETHKERKERWRS